MACSSSKLGPHWGRFDLPIIDIKSCYSQFEALSVNHDSLNISNKLAKTISKVCKKDRVISNQRDKNQAICAGVSSKDLKFYGKNQETVNIQKKQNEKRTKNQEGNDLSSRDSEDFSIHKKLKKEAISQSTNNKDDFDVVEIGSHFCSKSDNIRKGSSLGCSVKKLEQEQNNKNSEKNKKQVVNHAKQIIKVTRMLLKSENKEQFFEVELISPSKNAKKVILTKQEVLDHDPLLLVYFYEKFLHYKETSLSGETLKKL